MKIILNNLPESREWSGLVDANGHYLQPVPQTPDRLTVPIGGYLYQVPIYGDIPEASPLKIFLPPR
jgi:hypothetical protein